MSTNIKNSDGSLTKIAGKTLQYPVNNNINSTDSLQDAPIGHIISYMGTIAPAHYLICDGSTYNIDDYPKLADHFLANFGSKNYFGGDGTTTFGVPDLRGEFLRGTGTNSHADQGNGANVGVHQNATVIPRTAVWGQNTNYGIFQAFRESRTTNDVEGTQREADTTIKSATSTYGNIQTMSYASDYINQSTHYTSRPTNTSVLYCIKAESTYYMEIEDPGYSTNEVFTGKTWIDGKPIYRKVVETTTPNVKNSMVEIFNYSNLNVDTMIVVDGYIHDIEKFQTNMLPINHYESGLMEIITLANSSLENVRMKVISDTIDVSLKCTLILEYTKTTD